MKKLTTFKLARATNYFNQNQKVWVACMSGAQAAEVVGKFRGAGRYVRGWVRWDRKDDLVPRFVECDVADEFYEKIKGI